MNENVAVIRAAIKGVEKALDGMAPGDLLSKSTGRWHDPAVDASDLSYKVGKLLAYYDEQDGNFDFERLPTKSVVARLDHLKTNIVPNLALDPDRGTASFSVTLSAVRDWFEATSLKPSTNEVSTELARERTRVRAISARLSELEPKTVALASMLERIESAHQAADELPTDLQSLTESREKVKTLTTGAMTDAGAITTYHQDAKSALERLSDIEQESSKIMAKCQSAYVAATSVGLAASFAERGAQLRRNGVWWIGGLIISLFVASTLGASRLSQTSALLAQGSAPAWMIGLSALIAMLSLGAPLWFGWLATRQIGHCNRLAEDYAFKAAVSRAYEGYRAEAERVDKNLEKKLLESALSRLDEQPLRLVEARTPSSPLTDILSSDVVRTAAKSVPNFATQVKDLAGKLISKETAPGPDRGRDVETKRNEDPGS